MAELPAIKLPRASVGDEVVVTSEETGQKWSIVSTNRAQTRRRFRAMTAAATVPTPPPPTPPTIPPGATVITPGTDIRAHLAAGRRSFLLRAGVHRFSLGSAETPYANVAIVGEAGAVIDGTGLDPHMAYLGPKSGTWTLADFTFRGFHPNDSGIIGVGDGCRLEMTSVIGVGMGRAGKPYEHTSHAVYFHGTGTGLIEDCDLRGFPGAAVHAYRGSPVVEVIRTKMGAFYESALIYSGRFVFTDCAFVEPAAAWDIQVSGDSTGQGVASLIGCTGTGPNGAVRRTS